MSNREDSQMLGSPQIVVQHATRREKALAATVVAVHARDLYDCANLLEMLGTRKGLGDE